MVRRLVCLAGREGQEPFLDGAPVYRWILSAAIGDVFENNVARVVTRITMKKLAAILNVTFLYSLLFSQTPSPPPAEMAGEPHHTLLLQNSKVRVFLLKLEPDQTTLPHRHNSFYVYLSVHPIMIGNEVRGRGPVLTRLEAGEVHTSKGGFTLAERNRSSGPAEVLVIEPAKQTVEGFNEPICGFRWHDAACGEAFAAPSVRGYSLVLGVGGRTEEHEENFDRLLIATSELKLRETGPGEASSELQMKAGEVRWFPRGGKHATTNIGTERATFVVLEFM
ncbi:MAG TPA: hypothetical protein VFL42_09425 [Terriglobales bacterium]|nr:hypothetical protein [Terriglobales bacterium]